MPDLPEELVEEQTPEVLDAAGETDEEFVGREDQLLKESMSLALSYAEESLL